MKEKKDYERFGKDMWAIVVRRSCEYFEDEYIHDGFISSDTMNMFQTFGDFITMVDIEYFGKRFFEYLTDNFMAYSDHYGDRLWRIAQDCGLMEYVPYNRAKHGHLDGIGEFLNEGDNFWFWGEEIDTQERHDILGEPLEEYTADVALGCLIHRFFMFEGKYKCCVCGFIPSEKTNERINGR